MNKGPVYGVELIDSLPLFTGSMRQAMPSRDDLERVREVCDRAAAGFEVLLAHYRRSHACEEIVKRNIWHGGNSLVPKFVAICPECGEQLLIRTNEWETETGRPFGVEYECLGEEFDHAGHKWHQSDWQPVMDSVERWFEVER